MESLKKRKKLPPRSKREEISRQLQVLTSTKSFDVQKVPSKLWSTIPNNSKSTRTSPPPTQTRANCYRKVREQALILFSSASATSVHQQHQCISSISTSAASPASVHHQHHQHKRISITSASAAPVHQPHQCISSISASAVSAHQKPQCISSLSA